MRCRHQALARPKRADLQIRRLSDAQIVRFLPRGRLSLSPPRSWPADVSSASTNSVTQAASTPSSNQRRRRFSNERRNRASGVLTSKILRGPRSTGYAANSSRTCEISITGTRSYAVRMERGRPSNLPQVTSTCVGVTRTIAISRRLPRRRTFVLLDRIERLFECQHLRRVCWQPVPASVSLLEIAFGIDDRQPARVALEGGAHGCIEQARVADRLRAVFLAHFVGGFNRPSSAVASIIEESQLALLGQATGRDTEQPDSLASNLAPRQLDRDAPDDVAHISRVGERALARDRLEG